MSDTSLALAWANEAPQQKPYLIATAPIRLNEQNGRVKYGKLENKMTTESQKNGGAGLNKMMGPLF